MFRNLTAGLVLLATAMSANATVEIYLSGSNSAYGLTNPDLAFKPILDPPGVIPPDPYSGYQLINGAVPAFGDVEVDFANEWLYIWLKFDGEPNSVTMQGLNLAVEPADKVERLAYYVMDNESMDGSNEKRWDGDVTTGRFTTNPVILAAVTAKGLKNTNVGGLSHDPLWVGAGGIRTALIGAVEMAPDTTLATLSLGPLGIQYAGGAVPAVAFGTAYPEPATLLLLAVAGLLSRRR